MKNLSTIVSKVENPEDGLWLSKRKIAEKLDISVHTLKSYRKLYWCEGIHFQYISTRTIKYNSLLIINWLVNIFCPEAHQRGWLTDKR